MSKTNREAMEAELARLRSAKPSRVASFAAARLARIAELTEALTNLPAETRESPKPDARTEKALRASAGGDRFGK